MSDLKPTRKKRIGLLWHSSRNDNLGVGALTVSNILIVEQVARTLGMDVEFRLLAWFDPTPSQIDQPNASEFAMRGKSVIDPRGLYREARQCDVVLDISAGDSFSDIYGRRRFIFNLLAKLAVILARTPLVNSPQTLGPFKLWWGRVAATFLMHRSSAVVSRDVMSTDYAKSLGIFQVIEATDVAMRLPYTKAATGKGKKVKVGFNVSGFLYDGHHEQENMVLLKTNYPAMCHALVKYFHNHPDCELHLVSHVIGGYSDDFRPAEKLATEFPGVVLVPRFKDPSAAKSYISGLDFFFGSRMHACIAAFSSGVPVVPIAYSRKFAGLFSSLGYNATVDCMSMTDTEIVAKVIEGFANRNTLKAQVATAFQNADARLAKYEDVIRKELLKP